MAVKGIAALPRCLLQSWRVGRFHRCCLWSRPRISRVPARTRACPVLARVSSGPATSLICCLCGLTSTRTLGNFVTRFLAWLRRSPCLPKGMQFNDCCPPSGLSFRGTVTKSIGSHVFQSQILKHDVPGIRHLGILVYCLLCQYA